MLIDFFFFTYFLKKFSILEKEVYEYFGNSVRRVFLSLDGYLFAEDGNRNSRYNDDQF